MEKLRRNLGITLVALVVTIIILLILAGITIGQLQNSGLFNKTQVAKETYTFEAEQEQLELEIANLKMQMYLNNNGSTTTLNDLKTYLESGKFGGEYSVELFYEPMAAIEEIPTIPVYAKVTHIPTKFVFYVDGKLMVTGGERNTEVASNRDVDVQQLKNQIKQELMQEMTSSDGNPIGTIIAVMGNTAPDGYLKCDGTVYNISQYQNLANYFGTQFKDGDNNPKINNFGGDGTTTFAVPDLQGEFLRGTGTNGHSNQGSGTAVGTHQDATTHVYCGYNKNNDLWVQSSTTDSNDFYARNAEKIITSSITTGLYWRATGTFGGNAQAYYTSRPTNTSVLYCIKY